MPSSWSCLFRSPLRVSSLEQKMLFSLRKFHGTRSSVSGTRDTDCVCVCMCICHSYKFSKPEFSNTWTVNFQMFKLVLEKPEEPGIKLPTSAGSSKKQESSRKTFISALLTMPKPSTVWITINCGKFLKRWEYQTTWPASWEAYMQVRKQQLELDMEQQTGSR